MRAVTSRRSHSPSSSFCVCPAQQFGHSSFCTSSFGSPIAPVRAARAQQAHSPHTILLQATQHAEGSALDSISFRVLQIGSRGHNPQAASTSSLSMALHTTSMQSKVPEAPSVAVACQRSWVLSRQHGTSSTRLAYRHHHQQQQACCRAQGAKFQASQVLHVCVAHGSTRRHSHIVCTAASPLHATSSNASTQEAAQPASTEAVAAAWALLKDLTLKSFRGMSAVYVETHEKREALRQAIQLVYHMPWPAAGWVPRPTTSPPAPPAPSNSTPQGQTPAASDPGPTIHQQQQPASSAAATGSGTDGAGQAADIGAGPLVMIGLMASDVRMGARAMRDYCQALGLAYTKPESRVQGVSSAAAVQGPVYLKYNSQSQVCYVSPYQGKERGVLLQLGAEQLGHFPLGLWDEDMRHSAPAL